MGRDVSFNEWSLAGRRLCSWINFINEKTLGDPRDDVWFDFDSKKLEIGFRPKKGVFIGEVREWRNEENCFDFKRFLDYYNELVENEVFVETEASETPETLGVPCREYVVATKKARDEYAKRDWGSVFFLMNETFDVGKYVAEADLEKELPEFPVVIDSLKNFAAFESEQALGSYFDAWIYVAETLFLRIAPEARKKFQTSTFEELGASVVCLSRGWNRVYFATDGVERDYPVVCGTLLSVYQDCENSPDVLTDAETAMKLKGRALRQSTDGWGLWGASPSF